MTLESEINQLKVAIEEVKGNSSFDLSSWLAANRDHLLLMGAELLLVVVLLSCFFSSNSSNNRRRSSLFGLGISPAELVLLNAQTGVNVKVRFWERFIFIFLISIFLHNRNLFTTVLSHCLICRLLTTSNLLQVIVVVVELKK